MKTDPDNGTALPNFFTGKNRFVHEQNLRIVTHTIGGGPGGRPSIENILAEMKKGQDVELRVDWSNGGAHRITLVGIIDLGPFGAGIAFNDPDDGKNQTVWSWLDTNPGGTLRPGLYGTVAFESAGAQVITVPRDAVVDTGLQQHVFVASGDRFEPPSHGVSRGA